jgi:hypothetical protein
VKDAGHEQSQEEGIMTNKYVIVRLTEKEAAEIIVALDDRLMTLNDRAEQGERVGRDSAAASRAYDKVQTARTEAAS